MKNISNLMVSERRLYKADTIPFELLTVASNINSLVSSFTFKDANISEDENKNITLVKLGTGEFLFEKKVYAIDLLLIDRTSITFRLNADSKIAKEFFKTIEAYLSHIDHFGVFKGAAPMVLTEETVCVVTLDIDYKGLFSNKLVDYIEENLSNKLSSQIHNSVKADILPKSLVFNVGYSELPTELTDNGVTILPKNFIIEPRVGVNPNDNRFFTVSPTDSKSHFQILKEFERLFKQKKK